MTIATLPTRNPADLGAALYDARTPNANELAAVNVEKIKDRLIEVVTEVGLSNGATAGSINEMRAAFTSGAYSSILRRIGSAYGAQRLGGGLGAPTVADDSGEGYAPGSWWVQVFGLDNPSTLAFFLCIDATDGAAVWVQIKAGADPSDADPLASGVADPGTSPDFSRSDHVHPIQGASVEEIAITNGVTLAAGDALALVAGRVSKADARAGSVVPGYVGQCLTGGTGDAGGTIKALVIVGGIAAASGLTPGAPVYLSTSTLGAVTSATPSGLGGVSQVVGVAVSATLFAIQVAPPVTIDWCSPLDIPTNGIFYGRASSANLLASGRITTNGIADLFGTGRFATVDGSGSAPAFISGGGPGSDAWFFVKTTRADRLRIVHDAGMTGVAWSGIAVNLPLSAGVSSLLAKTNSSTPQPFDFGQNGGEAPYVAGDVAGSFTSKGWRSDAFSRAGTGLAVSVWSRGSMIAESTGVANSAGSNDIVVGNRSDLGNGFDGRIAAFALWNRALSAAEIVGLTRWTRREFIL